MARAWLDNRQIVGELNGLMQLAVTDTLDKRLKDSLQRVACRRSSRFGVMPNRPVRESVKQRNLKGCSFQKAVGCARRRWWTPV